MHAFDHLGKTVRLGKGAPKEDPRTLRMARYLRALPPNPEERLWYGAVPAWPMFMNDIVGDCTCASLGHAEVCWNANNGSSWRPNDRQILEMYQAISGYDPDVPGTDSGAQMLDALNHARRFGIGGRKIEAYVAIDHGNIDEFKTAINLFGGVYLGLSLPLSAQNQSEWKVSLAGTDGKAERGSWGGHAVFAVAYNAAGVWIVTWAGLQFVTWRWLLAYCDEAYALLSADWADADGAPNDLDMAALRADLSAVAS